MLSQINDRSVEMAPSDQVTHKCVFTKVDWNNLISTDSNN